MLVCIHHEHGDLLDELHRLHTLLLRRKRQLLELRIDVPARAHKDGWGTKCREPHKRNAWPPQARGKHDTASCDRTARGAREGCPHLKVLRENLSFLRKKEENMVTERTRRSPGHVLNRRHTHKPLRYVRTTRLRWTLQLGCPVHDGDSRHCHVWFVPLRQARCLGRGCSGASARTTPRSPGPYGAHTAQNTTP